ncbi:hypothetical protein BCR44DRAFT_177725 [Catenaria anguillulae PL171]|uniref:Transmembrane protein n=1 Tax=Catenaria anguillulae PL171 TaxID=765915 RepID=A0A1Y2I0W4_9FUNG|nr:hypothetical protein BCR44DRAFT_177725 [Catenaria anguillulae PL171]
MTSTREPSSTMSLRNSRPPRENPCASGRRASWLPNHTSILCLLMLTSVALLLATTTYVQADASASALREGNIVSPGKVARDPHAFGPVEDLTGAVLADEVPARDATGQVVLVGSVGVMPKVPRAEVGGNADGDGPDVYSTTLESVDSSRSRNPVFWIALTSSAAVGLVALYTLHANRQQRDRRSQSATTDISHAPTGPVHFLDAVPARSRSPTKGTRLDSGFISGRSQLLGDTVTESKEDTVTEGEGDHDRMGTSNSTVLGHDELHALDLD